MRKIMIEVGSKAYPCCLTMGAMLLFKRNTGKDVSQMDACLLYTSPSPRD